TPSYLHNPHVPLWMDGALKKALSLSSELRYECLSEFVHDLKSPNPEYLNPDQKPFMERNPLLAWQLIAGCLLFTQLVTLIFWLG
ncbi:MAG: hypothetical protein R3208_02365, partial [Ketobacteraceae bacterium]|nr:hypothetical protein [Ketobacteraceae bacterium]